MVRTIKLSDGKEIPAIGWGSGSGGLFNAGQKAIDAGIVALKEGILHIDTAQIYQTENETRESIAQSGIPREKIWVTTKISTNSAANDGTTPENIRKSVTESIERLGTIPDLILIHNPHIPEKGKIGQFWTYLEDLVLDGTLKGCSLGFSNFRPQDIEDVLKVARIKPVANQLEFHPYVLAHLEPVLKLQEANGIVTQAYGPLTPLLRHGTGGPLKPVLERIAKEHNIDPTTVLLLWTVQKGVVAVTTSGRPENIKKIAAIDALPNLSAEEIAEIDATGKQVHFRHYTEHMTTDFPAPNLPEDL